MPTFSYKGYDFEVDHTPTEAEFAQMSAYVDTLPTKAPTKQKREATWGESLAQGAAQVGNVADLAGSTLLGSAAALLGAKDTALGIEERRKARKETRDSWGAPQETELSFPQKAVNALNPLSLITSGLSPAATVDTARQAGESDSAALKAGVVDALGNAAGMILPGFKQGGAVVRAATGAGANMAQEYATKKIIQDMLDTEEGKRQFEVTPESLALAGLAGGTMAAAAGAKPRGKTKVPTTPINKLFDEVDTTPAPVKTPTIVPEQLKLFDQFEERSPISKYQTEMAPDMWRVDENGIPIRADLSMEVQNLQQPLQRNLFGDELDVNFPRDPNKPLDMATGDIPGVERFSDPVQYRNDPEGQIPLTEAIDLMPEGIRNRVDGKFAEGTTRQSALDLLRNEIPAGNELEAARLAADHSNWMREQALAAGGDTPKGFNAKMKKQKGALLFGKDPLEIVPTDDGYVAKVGDKEVGYLRSNITPEQRAALGEDASVDMVKVQDDFKGKGVGRALYEAWAAANEGNVIPSGKTSKEAWNQWKRNLPGGVDKFVNQEAQRILGGADRDMVIGNIPDPEVAQRVQARAALLQKQGGAISPEVFLKDFPEFVKSKMVGEDGLLKRFYHGTSKDKVFSDIKAGPRGAFFSDDPKAASDYAKDNDSRGTKYNPDTRRYEEVNSNPHVHEVYLNVTNPYKMDEADLAKYSRAENYAKFQKELTAKAKAQGHDGIDWGGGVISTFDASQSKSTLSPKKVPFNFKKQGGGLLVDWGKKKEVEAFDNIPGIKDSLRDIGHAMIDSPEQAISLAQKFSDVSQNTAQKAISYLTKGGIYLKGKVNNPVVHYTVDRFLDAEGRAKAEVNEKVHSGYVAELRSLSKEQYKQAAELLNGADLRKIDLTPELMTKHGVDPRVQGVVQLHQDLMNDALGKMNEALVAAGKKPVEARDGYSAMNMTGDYRKVAYKTIDGVKTVVGVISADRKAGKVGWTLDKVEKEMLSRDPELEFVALPDRSATGGKGSPHEAFQDALNTIGKDNPHMQEFLATLQDVAKSDVATYMGMQKHSLGKKGIWGMEGRKPWMNEVENATAFFENQAKYLENTYNWAALADAARDVNSVLRDEGVATKHGEAVKLSEQYMTGAMGLNPDKLGRAVDKAFDALGDKVGIGPSNLRSVVGMSKRVANTWMLSLNPSFLGIQIVQGPVGIPAMTALLRGRGLAPGRSVLTGGLDSFAEAGLTLMKSKVSPSSLSALDKAALKYAKDNHIYATDMVEHANQTQKGAGFYITKATQSPAAIVESGTRAQVYMAFVKMMQDSGMTQKDGLFQQAHRVTDMVMNNYSAMEKPKVYDALGPIGSMAYNLKSFAHNEISRWSLYARELGATGNAAPLLTQMATTIALAGVLGLPFYSQWESLYDYITKKLGNPRSLTLDVINMSEDLAAKMGPDYDKWKFAVSHGLSTIAGADVSKRVGLGDVLPSKVSDAAFAGGGKLADMAGTAAGLIGSPDEAHAKAAAVAWSPSILSAPLKEAWYTDDDTAYSMDPDKPRKAMARLNATDKLLKKIGISGVNESVQKERNYQLGVLDKTYQDYRDSAMTKMVYALAMGQPLSPADVKKYVETGQGDPNTLVTQLTTAIDSLQKTPEEKQLLKVGTTQSITQLMSIQRRLDNR